MLFPNGDLFNKSLEVETDEIEVWDVEPSKTWYMNVEAGRLEPYIDEIEAVKQFVEKAFLTARGEFVIYNSSYGSDIISFLSRHKSRQLFMEEFPRILIDAIIEDDRITNVKVTSIDFESDIAYVRLEIDTVYDESLREVYKFG